MVKHNPRYFRGFSLCSRTRSGCFFNTYFTYIRFKHVYSLIQPFSLLPLQSIDPRKTTVFSSLLRGQNMPTCHSHHTGTRDHDFPDYVNHFEFRSFFDRFLMVFDRFSRDFCDLWGCSCSKGFHSRFIVVFESRHSRYSR